MSKINILGEIHHFLDQTSAAFLEITFDQLEIHSLFQGNLLNKTIKEKAKICIGWCPRDGLAQMELRDNLVFQFTLKFTVPATLVAPYTSTALQLPRPLAEGQMYLDSKKLVLQFVIDAPNKETQVHIQQEYTNVLGIKKIGKKLA